LYGAPVVVAAAGNLGNQTPHYPAAESNVPGLIAVAASNRGNSLALFSSFGSWVHIAAPGEGVVSSVPGGGAGAWSGTSMAAPLVAGTAALMRKHNPALKAADITNLIASKGASLCNSSYKQVDAAAALGRPQNSQLPCQVNVPLVFG
jgi:subtilisin family serine protease